MPPGPYHLLLAFATLHGPGLDGKDLLVRLVKNHLQPRAGIVLSFPNARYVDTRQLFGAKQRNYREVEHAHGIHNLVFYRRYLQKKGFVVRVTGKSEWLLFAYRRPKEVCS